MKLDTLSVNDRWILECNRAFYTKDFEAIRLFYKLNIIQRLPRALTDKKFTVSQTWFLFAIQSGQMKLVDLLAELEPSLITFADCYAISVATFNGDLDMVKFLISKGSRTNTFWGNSTTTPALMAAEKGRLDILKTIMTTSTHSETFDVSELVWKAVIHVKIHIAKYLIKKTPFLLSQFDEFLNNVVEKGTKCCQLRILFNLADQFNVPWKISVIHIQTALKMNRQIVRSLTEWYCIQFRFEEELSEDMINDILSLGEPGKLFAQYVSFLESRKKAKLYEVSTKDELRPILTNCNPQEVD